MKLAYLLVFFLFTCTHTFHSFVLKVENSQNHRIFSLTKSYGENCNLRVRKLPGLKNQVSRVRLNVLGNKGIFDDDLPNILGINPLEAALIGGVLYYFYGPNVLYEYAREAGKFISTYGPIVKEVSLDIFYEFREYFEEEREREMMKKSGVNIDDIPRRTSNIIERFQEQMEKFSEVTDTSSSILASAYSSSTKDTSDLVEEQTSMLDSATVPSIEDSEKFVERNRKQRKSKKEVLEKRNVNIEQVKKATEYNDEVDLSNELKNSFGTVKSYIDNRAEKYKVDNNEIVGPASYASQSFASSDDPVIEKASKESESMINSLPSSEYSTSSQVNENLVGISKFQEQLAGDWNARIMRQEKYNPTDADYNNVVAPISRSFHEPNNDSAVINNEKGKSFDDVDETLEKEYEFPPFNIQDATPVQNNIPDEITIADTANEFNLATRDKALSLLEEIDQDYSNIRKKLLKFIESGIPNTPLPDSSTSTKSSDVTLMSKNSSPKKYWPPNPKPLLPTIQQVDTKT